MEELEIPQAPLPDTVESTIERMQLDVKYERLNNPQDCDSVSWGNQIGILLTVHEAEQLIRCVERVKKNSVAPAKTHTNQNYKYYKCGKCNSVWTTETWLPEWFFTANFHHVEGKGLCRNKIEEITKEEFHIFKNNQS